MIVWYWLLAIAWFVLVLLRGAYLRGQEERIKDSADLFWYVLPWGVFGGLLWPATFCFAIGFKLGQENP